MSKRRLSVVCALGILGMGGALPVLAEDTVDILRVRPESGVIRGVTDGEVSTRRGEYIEFTIRYNLETDCPQLGDAGTLLAYFGLGTDGPLPFDILPGPGTSEIEESIPRTGRGQIRFRWSFQCHADAPPLVSGYVWNLGASLSCSSGELDFIEPLLGLDYWVIDCSGS
jgi:hypothetical protein